MAIAGLPFLDLYKFGMCIGKSVRQSKERVVFIASGDLSHKLTHEAPYGYSKAGKEFDDLFVSSIKNLDIERLLDISEEMSENAGECGLRSFLMMFGALDGYELKPELYSYEGPFGVGYSVAKFSAGGMSQDRQIFMKVKEKNREKIKGIRDCEDAFVKLARIALETYIKEKKVIDVPKELPEEMLRSRTGVFVSLKLNGQLRGCIGTTGPTRKNIAEEIIHNAISAGTQDPRFFPVEEDELENLVYSVDVLKEPEPIKSIDQLDAKKYGVIVRAGRRSGLLLPNLEGVDTPEKQVSIALQKAGISKNENYTMERFEVIRHK